MGRISRQEMYMETAKIVAKRSTCNRAKVGAVLVKGKRIITIGYGGAPSKLPHCIDVGCEIGPESGGGCIRTVHAEANVISFAARYGIPLVGSDLYITLSPCYSCSKLIINSGIQRVISLEPYRDSRGIELLERAGVKHYLWEELSKE